MAIPGFIRVKDESVYYSGDKSFVFFVPESYFTKKCAVIEGEYVELIGLLNYCICDTDKSNSDDIEIKNLKTFNFPSRFITKPGRIIKKKDISIIKETKPSDYRLLIYTNNDIDQIIVSTKVSEDIINVEDFFRLIVITGDIPKTIPYDELYTYFLDSIKYNGSSFGINAQVFGCLVSKLCRSKKDNSIPFRLSKDNNMNNYDSLPIGKVPKYDGAYISITSENWDDSLIGALSSKGSKYSPLEKIVMGK